MDKLGYWVYLLQCSDHSLYCGTSTDPLRRLEEHNEGKGSKYVRARLPAKLAWTSPLPMLSKSEALQMEAKIKRMSPSAKRKLVRGERKV